METQSSERQGRDFDRRSQDLGLYPLSPVRARHQSRLTGAVRENTLIGFFFLNRVFSPFGRADHTTSILLLLYVSARRLSRGAGGISEKALGGLSGHGSEALGLGERNPERERPGLAGARSRLSKRYTRARRAEADAALLRLRKLFPCRNGNLDSRTAPESRARVKRAGLKKRDLFHFVWANAGKPK